MRIFFTDRLQLPAAVPLRPPMTDRPDPAVRTAWFMLIALTTGFSMSQAFRTAAAIMAPPLAAEFALTPQQLGLFAAAFHFSFGALQLFMNFRDYTGKYMMHCHNLIHEDHAMMVRWDVVA